MPHEQANTGFCVIFSLDVGAGLTFTQGTSLPAGSRMSAISDWGGGRVGTATDGADHTSTGHQRQ